jgi:hypothetical protein
MKVAGTIGLEEMRSTLVSGPSGSNTPDASFAESFGKEIIAAPKRGVSAELDSKTGVPIRHHIAGRSSISVKAHEAEAGDAKPQEISSAKQIGKANVLGEPMRIAPKGTENVSVVDGRSSDAVDGELPMDEGNRSKEFLNVISAKMPVRMISSEENPIAAERQGTFAKESDADRAGGEISRPQGRPLLVPSELTDALQIEMRNSLSQQVGHPNKEDKDNIRIQGSGAQHKPAKKEGDSNSSAGERANDISSTLDMPLSQAVIEATTSTEGMRKDPATGTAVPEKGSSSSITSASARAVQTSLRKVPIAGPAGSLGEVKKGDASEQSTAANSLPQDSDHELRDVKSSPGPQQRMRDVKVVLSPAEKTHMALEEVLQPAVSAVTQVREHAMTVPMAEKIVPASGQLPGGQTDIVPTAPHGYAADEHKTLMATSTTLEVGLPGGSHGWLKVRAELTGDGVVHASVTSNTSAGTEMLRRELPSLTNYLHQEQIPIHSVAIHAPPDVMDSSNASSGGGQNHESGRGAAEGQKDSRDQSTAVLVKGGDVFLQEAQEDTGGAGWPLSAGHARAGGWLNVRA